MARAVTIQLTDVLESQIRAEAAARGFRTLDECALALLREALLMPLRMPTDPAELEAELLKGLEGEAEFLSPEDWAKMKSDLIERHRRSKAG